MILSLVVDHTRLCILWAHLATLSFLLHGLALSALGNRTALTAALHYAVIANARGAVIHTPFLIIRVGLVVLFAHRTRDYTRADWAALLLVGLWVSDDHWLVAFRLWTCMLNAVHCSVGTAAEDAGTGFPFLFVLVGNSRHQAGKSIGWAFPAAFSFHLT